jgi:hypothetical protein
MSLGGLDPVPKIDPRCNRKCISWESSPLCGFFWPHSGLYRQDRASRAQIVSKPSARWRPLSSARRKHRLCPRRYANYLSVRMAMKLSPATPYPSRRSTWLQLTMCNRRRAAFLSHQ